MSPPIVLHCNYVEQGQSVARMCELAARWGYNGIEFRHRRSGVKETDQAYLDEIARGVDKYRIEVVLFGAPGPNLMQADADQRRRDVDEFERFLRDAARRVRLSVINAFTGNLVNPAAPPGAWEQNGSGCATDAHWNQAVEGYKRLGDVAADLGIRFAFETHMNYLHDLAAPARKLCDLTGKPAVGINLDYANIHHFPKPPSMEQTITQCGDRLYLVHIKNICTVAGAPGTPPARVRCGLADGDLNTRQFFRLVKAAGYRGPLVVEAPRPGDREWFAQQDLAYVRSILADEAW